MINNDYQIRIIMSKDDWERAVLNTNMSASPFNDENGRPLPADTTISLRTTQICLGKDSWQYVVSMEKLYELVRAAQDII